MLFSGGSGWIRWALPIIRKQACEIPIVFAFGEGGSNPQQLFHIKQKRQPKGYLRIIMKSFAIAHDEIQNKFWMKYFSCEKCEIKFALTFAKQIFHTLQRISSQSDFTRRRRISLKKAPLARCFFLVGAGGFEPPKAVPTDLQSAPFGHSGTLPHIALFNCE